MTAPGGEMPFLEHLEELRSRILRSLGALVVGFGIGLWIVERFRLVSVLKGPIDAYLPTGKLTVLSPTEPVVIVFKLGFVVGLVLASPVVIWQVWAFLAPALYERERKVVVPALLAGLLLFLVGGALGWVFVVPQALRVLFSFQSEALTPMITYDAYFDFILQIVLALGISFELPLVIIILASLGVVSPAGLHRFRRFAIVGSCIAGAVLSPGTDIISMIMMTIPLILLYEVGVAGSILIHRRRLRQRYPVAPFVVLLAALAGLAAPARAQQAPGKPAAQDTAARRPAAAAARDTTRAPPGQPVDSATARRLGLPTAPSHTFAPEDSAYRELLGRPGYTVTKFRGDTATILVEEKRLELDGGAMTEREGATMEADNITYEERACALDARGDPKLFNEGQVLVGDGIRYDTCRRRGVVREALTTFKEQATTWYLRGDVARDSVANRIFAGHGQITSCDLPVPHYSFAARKIKWVSKTALVARPVVLYVRDVPVAWFPFIYQDLRPGRRSGILVPQVGLNDIVRFSSGYRRQITNIGYYWATNDYMDVTGRLDWFARRYVQYGASMNYRVLDRFLSGSMAVDQTRESGPTGGVNTSIRWDHRQQFDLTTSLNLGLNYVTNTRVVNQNAIDPNLNTQQIRSQLNFSKRFRWGTVSVGGNRFQNISDGSRTEQLPSFNIAPKPFALGSSATWSPGLSISRDLAANQLLGKALVVGPTGQVDTVEARRTTRTFAANLDTPFRFGAFNWANAIRYTDRNQDGLDSVRYRVPDPSTADPNDSVTVTRFVTNQFQSEFDWNTGINLPLLFRSTWKLQPTVGITNTTGGAFAIRNRQTNGQWVTQGKRVLLSLSAAPTFFGFFRLPFVHGVQRVRHSINPILNYSYAPEATVNEAYARAVSQPGQMAVLRSPAQQLLTLSLQQTFEGKVHAARPSRPGQPRDTIGVPDTATRKIRLLSIQTSSFAYDFEQAKRPGRTGFTTQTMTNSFLSDLLPGFNLSLTHDLWRGQAGSDTARFSPFLTAVNANFSLNQATIRRLLSSVGLVKAAEPGAAGAAEQPTRPYTADLGLRQSFRPGSFYSTSQFSQGRGRGFTSSFNLTISRSRPPSGVASPFVAPARKNLGYNLGFSPTAFWSVSWSGQYDIGSRQFVSQTVRLERDLHEWRAAFNFVKNANGNFALFFSIFLTDLPDLKWDYQQTTIEQ